MQLVFLSGGSGKRLWPLSNNARSKQFLSLLRREDGAVESMVQRVVRQATECLARTGSGHPLEMTVVTNVSQTDIIALQLGDRVRVVTEPERRDTFPAIALASAFLKWERGCADDEVVVVMPCDPYTEAGYFRCIGRMTKCVENGVADLVLMGVTPTCPSEKFGYIVPVAERTVANPAEATAAEGVFKVQRFTEKPTEEKAAELLKEGAFWNGGVFAFRLGYLMETVHRYVEAGDYATLLSRYSELPKNSFDYEVVEKTASVAVVPFSGEWKDLGTWNTLSEVLPEPAIGHVLMGPHCDNTHVVNELQTPIFVEGMKDTVVAASPDGILVCAKEETEHVKQYVEQFQSRPMYEERRWGTYRVLDNSVHPCGRHSLTKSLTLYPGKQISYQVHHHRSEVWTIVEGEGWFALDGKVIPIREGDVAHIPVGHWHALKARTHLTVIEVQMGHPLVEEDIDRDYSFEWKQDRF